MASILNITPRPISTPQGEVWGRERLSQSHTLGSLSRWEGESTDRRANNSSSNRYNNVSRKLKCQCGMIQNYTGNHNTQYSTIWLTPRVALTLAIPPNRKKTSRQIPLRVILSCKFKGGIGYICVPLHTMTITYWWGCSWSMPVTLFIFISMAAEISSSFSGSLLWFWNLPGPLNYLCFCLNLLSCWNFRLCLGCCYTGESPGKEEIIGGRMRDKHNTTSYRQKYQLLPFLSLQSVGVTQASYTWAARHNDWQVLQLELDKLRGRRVALKIYSML